MRIGYKHSAETLKKLSDSHKGKPMLPQTRIALKRANTGRKCLNETKKKIGDANRGKTLPPMPMEVRQKISQALKGKLPKNIDSIKGWNKGLGSKTSEIRKLRSSLKYRIWRNKVFKRDNWTCQICFKRGFILHADHIKQFAFYPKLRFKVSNGRTLCKPCHLKTDSWGHKGKRYENS